MKRNEYRCNDDIAWIDFKHDKYHSLNFNIPLNICIIFCCIILIPPIIISYDPYWTPIPEIGVCCTVFLMSMSIRNIIIECGPKKISKIEYSNYRNKIIVDKNNKYGLLSPNTIIIPEYDLIQRVNKNLFICCKNNRYGLLHCGLLYSRKKIVPVEYNSIELLNDDTSEPILRCRKNSRCGLFYKNRMVIPVDFDNIEPLYGDIFTATQGSKTFNINYKGKRVM